MTTDSTGTSDITPEDLVAYAEERLPAGTTRRAAVEAHLAQHPADEARVQAYRRQDRAIRNAWGPVAEEPLPPRLQPAVLARRPGAALSEFGWPAALAASVIVAGWSGWMLGQQSQLAPDGAAEFAQRAAAQLGTSPMPATDTVEGITAVTAADAPAPDLSAAGLRLVSQQVEDDGLQAFQYAGPGGQPVRMFMSGRQELVPDSIHVLEAGDVNLAYWEHGAELFALGGAIEPEDLRALAYSAMNEMRATATAPEPPGTPLELEPIPPVPSDRIEPIQPEASLPREIPLADSTVAGQDRF